jgi:hypothetical protein
MGPIGDTHKLYNNARSRCEDPANPRYPICGGLGVKFLLPDFEVFLRVLGTRPARHVLARIDEKGNFEMKNVKWEFSERIPLKVRPSEEEVKERGRLKRLEKPLGPENGRWRAAPAPAIADSLGNQSGTDATPEAASQRRSAAVKRRLNAEVPEQQPPPEQLAGRADALRARFKPEVLRVDKKWRQTSSDGFTVLQMTR